MSAAPTIADRIARAVIRVAGSLPESLQRRLAGLPRQANHAMLDPEMALGLRLMNAAAGDTFETLPLAAGRAQIDSEAWIVGDARLGGDVREILVAGGDGPVRARLYRPAADSATGTGGALVYFHGGGWVLGNLESADSASRALAEKAETTVISIDYRLAPEHPYPAAIEDALAAFDDVCRRAEEFGIDPALVAIGGESAGGNITAVLAQRIARRGTGPRPCFQLMFMPVTDLSRRHDSYREFSSGYFLSEAQMSWYAQRYLPNEELTEDPGVSPLLASDLSGLPPAMVVTAGFDVLRDEGEAYAARLAAAGVPVAVRRVPGIVHGSINATGVGRTGREVLAEAAGALRTAMAFARAAGGRS